MCFSRPRDPAARSPHVAQQSPGGRAAAARDEARADRIRRREKHGRPARVTVRVSRADRNRRIARLASTAPDGGAAQQRRDARHHLGTPNAWSVSRRRGESKDWSASCARAVKMRTSCRAPPPSAAAAPVASSGRIRSSTRKSDGAAYGSSGPRRSPTFDACPHLEIVAQPVGQIGVVFDEHQVRHCAHPASSRWSRGTSGALASSRSSRTPLSADGST